MYLYLFCLSVVFLPHASQCIDEEFFSDVSDDCKNGRNISAYLTSGMGISDAYVFLIATPEPLNCTLNFFVSKENYALLVIEFLDWVLGGQVCGNAGNQVKAMVRGSEGVNICTGTVITMDNIENNMYRIFGEELVSVSILVSSNLECLKVMATSVRVLDTFHEECNDNETMCLYGSKILCMHKELECDGNNNCGIREEFDEDKNRCEKSLSISPPMIIVGTVIALISFALLLALLRNLLPSRKGTFIFKEDETLSERDRAAIQKDFQVKLKVLYSPDEAPSAEMIAVEDDSGMTYRDKLMFRRLKSFQKND